VALLGLVAQVCAGENPPKVALDNNEALFTVLTAINACGYDSELSVSDPLRAQIRAEVAKTIEASDAAKESTAVMCQFYKEHQQDDSGRTLAQYVSLALCLNPPPELTMKVKEAELPANGALSRAAGQSAVRYRGLPEAALGWISGTQLHGLSRPHGIARASECAQLWN
jgi:hypothetical protein